MHGGLCLRGRVMSMCSHSRRLTLAQTAILLLAPIALLSPSGCSVDSTLVLTLQNQPGIKLKSYLVEIVDQKQSKVLTHTGVRQFTDARDLDAEPLKLGFQFDRAGSFLIHVRAAAIPGLETLPK